MKILHTADWHIGKMLGDFPRFDEQIAFFEEMLVILDEKSVDVVVVAGDIFDNFSPSIESQRTFYKYIKKMSNNGKRAIIIIAGNHDSSTGLRVSDPLAQEMGIFIFGNFEDKVTPFTLDSGLKISKSATGFLELILPNYDYPFRIVHTPYINEIKLKKVASGKNGDKSLNKQIREILREHWNNLAENYCDNKGVNILMNHHFFVKKAGDVAEENLDDEKPLLMGGVSPITSDCISSPYQYVALGHLHRYHVVSETPCPIVYSGSPLPYSFGEADQKKFVVLVELEPNKKAIIENIEIQSGKTLKRKSVTSINEAVSWLEKNQDSLVELTIKTNAYISSNAIKSLQETHSGIVSIIPKLNSEAKDEEASMTIDLNKTIEELFCEYFESINGAKPSDGIVNLFKEIITYDINQNIEQTISQNGENDDSSKIDD